MNRFLLVFSFLLFTIPNVELYAQESHNFNFTNVSQNLNQTAYVSPIDIINLSNSGVPDVYNIMFSVSGTFQPDDELAFRNLQVYLNTGTSYNFNVASIDEDFTGNEFYVRVLKSNGIQLLTVKVVFGYANILEFENQPSFYPNPTSDYIHIPMYIKSLELYDFNGKLVRQALVQVENYILNIQDLEKGVYFLVLDGIVHKIIFE